MVVGLAKGEQFLASDPAALLAETRDVVFLDNGDLARLSSAGVTIWDRAGRLVERPVVHLDWDPNQIDKGDHPHFMAKEIHEQPRAVEATLAGRVDFEGGRVDLGELALADAAWREIERLQLVACGTSWHAALVGKFLVESIARLPVDVDYGSEFRYRDPLVGPRTLALGITQSGETADTLSAMEAARERGARLAAICNVPGSQATRASDATLLTHAGPEIGVASTKAFTTQLAALYLLALHLRQVREGPLPPELVRPLAELPSAIARALAEEDRIRALAQRLVVAEDFLFLGRGIDYPIALEGALKLKEISYVHAEGYPAGEMKHGPIALIDEKMPVVVLAGKNAVYDKIIANIEEVKARGGSVIAIMTEGDAEIAKRVTHAIAIPATNQLLMPILMSIPLQLLAYHIAVLLGADVDQPRNLAKSVTVE